MKHFVVFCLFFIATSNLIAEENFEREIIERLARLETKVDNNASLISETKKDLQKKMDDAKSETRSFEYWAFGIVISILFAFASFILWDRCTAVSPLESKSQSQEIRIRHLETAIKAISQKKNITPECLEQLGIA